MTAMRSMDAARSGGALFRRRLISRSDVKRAQRACRSQKSNAHARRPRMTAMRSMDAARSGGALFRQIGRAHV